MIGHARRLAALTALMVVASLASTIVPAASAAEPHIQAKASYMQSYVSWRGGRTFVCRSAPDGADLVTVNLYWNGQNYAGSVGGYGRGAGGFANVSGSWSTSNYDYSFGSIGVNGPLIKRDFRLNGYALLLVGSHLGITETMVIPVSEIVRCGGSTVARTAAPEPTARAAAKKCVNKKQFKRIKSGMKPAKVRSVLRVKGKKVTSAEYSLVQRFRKCGGGTVIVNYEKKSPTKPNRATKRYF